MGKLDRIITTPGIYNQREIAALCHCVSHQVMSASGAQPTLKAGNAPVTALVLHGVVGGGNHLPSGNPNARLPYLFYKKKSATFFMSSWTLRFPTRGLFQAFVCSNGHRVLRQKYPTQYHPNILIQLDEKIKYN